MSLKDLFCNIIERKPYDLSGIDTSKSSIRELIAYVSETYSNKVEHFNILDLDETFLDELLEGEDMTLKVAAALSKINYAIPHLRLKSYV